MIVNAEVGLESSPGRAIEVGNETAVSLHLPAKLVLASYNIRYGVGRFLIVHIDPHPAADAQLTQLKVMMDQVECFDGPKVLLGDFNTLSRQKCLKTRRFLESHGFTTPMPTGTPTW